MHERIDYLQSFLVALCTAIEERWYLLSLVFVHLLVPTVVDALAFRNGIRVQGPVEAVKAVNGKKLKESGFYAILQIQIIPFVH